jgi:autotransporter-associated beta strand protein
LLPGSGPGTANITPLNATGTVVLSGTNTYTGSTIVSSGTLKLGATGSINTSSNIITGAGATFDVSAISGYTLGAGYNLMGSGTVNGSVNTSAGTGIYGGTDGTYGTNTFANNLTLATGAAAYFDLGTTATGSNDEIVVNGTLTLNGNAIHVKAPGPSAFLGFNNYTLFSSSNLISVVSPPALVWDVAPANAAKYTLVVVGNTVILQYASSPGPFILTTSASPNPAYPNESVLIGASVSTNGSTLNTITVDASQIAGTAPGTTICDAGFSRHGQSDALHQQC